MRSNPLLLLLSSILLLPSLLFGSEGTVISTRSIRIILRELPDLSVPGIITHEEMFLLDPHYDAGNNRVDYYTLGNKLKVDYSYNEQGLTEKKTRYRWDDQYYLWEPEYEITYRYDNQNRLIETQTQELYSGLSKTYGFTNYPELSSSITQYIYRIQPGIEERFEEYSSSSSSYTYDDDDGSVIRSTIKYLNEYNRPDSSIWQVVTEDYTWREKSVYTYDEEGRYIRTEHFEQDDDGLPWRFTYTMETRYENHKITFVDMPVGHSDADSFIFEFELDHKEWVTAKRITMNGDKVILSTKYSYDINGNTWVEHEQVPEEVGHFAWRLNTDDFRDNGYLRYRTEPVGNNCTKTSNYARKDGADENGVLLDESTACYSPDGVLLLSNDIRRYDQEGSFTERDYMEYHYNTPDGMSGECIQYKASDEGSPTDHPVLKIIYDKDTLKRRIYVEMQVYDDLNKQWIPESKRELRHNKDSYLIYTENSDYDPTHNEWRLSYYTSFTRDSLNRTLEEETHGRLHRYEYDDRDNTIVREIYFREGTSLPWKGHYRISSVYDDSDNEIENILYQWDEEQAQWRLDEKRIKEGEGLEDFKKTTYDWKDNEWQLSRLEFNHRIETDSTNIYEKGYSIWDKDKNDWRISDLERCIAYKNEEKEVRESYYWNCWIGALDGLSHISTRYGDDFFIQQIYSTWDYDTESWSDSIRYTVYGKELTTFPHEGCSYLFERYDPQSGQWINDRHSFFTLFNDSLRQVDVMAWDADSNSWKKAKKMLFHLDEQRKEHTKELFIYNEPDDSWELLIKIEREQERVSREDERVFTDNLEVYYFKPELGRMCFDVKVIKVEE